MQDCHRYQKFASLRHYNSKHCILWKGSVTINTSPYSDGICKDVTALSGTVAGHSLEENYWCFDKIGKHCTQSIQAFSLAHEYSTSNTYGGDIF